MIAPLWLDLESFCEVPISAGTYRYAEAAEVDIFAWAIGAGPVQRIDMQVCSPGDLSMIRDMLHEAPQIIAHNAMFDRTVLRIGNLKLDTPIEKWRCTMVQALAHGLPGSLDMLGELLGLPQDKRKMKEGKTLMRLFCKPRPKNHKLRRATGQTHPQERARYLDYAGNDVEAMREVDARLPDWNMARGYPAPGEMWLPAHTELAHWHRDQRANDRGYQIDMDLVRGALRAVDRAQDILRTDCQDATEGAVESATQRDKLLEFICENYGIALPDMQKATLEKIIDDERFDEGLRELLRIRLDTCTTSTAKYKALAEGTSTDGRCRGTIQFNGAARTRRSAGRKPFQPQNLPRPSMHADEVEFGIRTLKFGSAHILFDNPMKLMANALRGCIISGKDKKLVVADLSNIEGRGLAWLAKEDWKLDAFRAFDAGTGPDLYKVSYGRSFGLLPEEVTKDQRQVGKVQELAFGFGGSVGAFITFAATYSLDLDAMAEKAMPTFKREQIERAQDTMAWYKEKGLPLPHLKQRTLVALFCLVHAWRDAHLNICALWKGLEYNAKEAVRNPGVVLTYGRFKFYRSGAWLQILLPSGRSLCYPGPVVDEEGRLSYMGRDQWTHQWVRLYTYGGKLAENATQSFARDVFMDSGFCMEKAGYKLVLPVHDENVTETSDSPEYSVDHLCKMMTAPPSWRPDGLESYAPDLPLAAAGFSGHRYRKD